MASLPTFWLGANAFERFAVRQIFAIKERSRDKACPFSLSSRRLELGGPPCSHPGLAAIEKFGRVTDRRFAQKSGLTDDVTVVKNSRRPRPNHPLSGVPPKSVAPGCHQRQPIRPTTRPRSGRRRPTARKSSLVLDGGPSPTSSLHNLDLSKPTRLCGKGD